MTASVSRNPLSRQSANDPSVTALSLFRNLCAQPDAETRGAGDLGRDSAERPEACETRYQNANMASYQSSLALRVALSIYLFESRKCSAWCVVTVSVRHRLRDEKGLHSILTSPESPHFASSILLLPSSPPLSSKISRDKSSERASGVTDHSIGSTLRPRWD